MEGEPRTGTWKSVAGYAWFQTGDDRYIGSVFLGGPIENAYGTAWLDRTAHRPGEDVFKYLSPLSWKTFLPDKLTFGNFVSVLQGDFSLALLNSVIVTFLSVFLGLAVAALAAFPLAVLRFRGRTVIFAIIVVSFLVPFEAIAIPLSSTFRDLGLANTYTGLILPALGNGLSIFLLRQFFMGVPEELNEASRLDGLSWFGVFRRIYLPLSKGALIGAGLILFVFQWQSFLWPLLVAPSPDVRVAPVAIVDFAQESGVDFGQMFAAAILTTIVPLLLLLFFQRYFTGSNASSGSRE